MKGLFFFIVLLSAFSSALLAGTGPDLESGIEFFKARDYERALTEFEGVLEREPGNAEAHFYLGNIFFVHQDFDKALDSYSRCITFSPSHVGALTNRGVIYFNKRSFRQALRDFSSVLSVAPDDVTVLSNRASAYVQLAQVEPALADFSRIIELIPTAHAFRNRAHLYALMEEYEKALKDNKRALSLASNDHVASNAIAWIYATARDEKVRSGLLAMTFARKALAIKEKDSYYDTLAAAYAEAGFFDQAVEAAEKAISLAKDDTARFTYQLLLDEAYSQGKTFCQWENAD